MNSIIDLDRTLFRFLNEIHNDTFDVIMYWISNKYTWIPLYALLIFLIIKKYKKKSYIILPAIALMITITDQGCNQFKYGVKRPRPCREAAQFDPPVRRIEGVKCSKYGFFSAHAANSFALATLLSTLFLPFYRRIRVPFFIWAAVTAYSRIYLGVHYPLDIIAGAAYGILVGQVILYVLGKLGVRAT